MENFESASYCRMSLFLAHRALNELKFIISAKNKGNGAANSDTIRFYSITLHYMLIMELTKLLEKKITGSENFASLYRLNNEVNDQRNPTEMDSNHRIIKKRLDKINEYTFFKKVKYYRDKKFAHTDKKGFSLEALEIIGFSVEEIEKVSSLLYDLQDIINDCLKSHKGGLTLYEITTTKNFLNYCDDYKGFALSRHTDFLEWKQNQKH